MTGRRPVVVTGVGLVTAVGTGVDAWRNLIAGRSGIHPVTSFATGQSLAEASRNVASFFCDDTTSCPTPCHSLASPST